MVRAFSPVRPASSPKGLALSRRELDSWVGIGGGGGSPPPVENYLAHYDASGLSASQGEEIVSLPDGSSNGYDLSTFSTNPGPLYEENGINGNPSLHFIAADSRTLFLSGGLPSAPSEPIYAFAVMQFTDTSNHTIVVGLGHLSTGARSMETGKLNARYWLYNGSSIDSGISTDTSPHIQASRQGGGMTGLHRLDGSQIDSGPVGNNSPVGIHLGIFGNGNNPMEGYIGEVVLYDRDLTSTEIDDIEAHLASKWGITI